MKPRCFSIITRYTVYCHIAQPCMFDILLGRISYSFVSIFFFTGQVAAPCQAPSATFTLHENLKFLTHFFFVDNCRIMLQVTLRPLFYQSSASVFDTVAWCASNLSWPCYLKFTLADHIIGLLFGKPPVKWLQQRFCEESTLQRSECRCGSSTCSLVGTHCALVWNEPLCAVTLFLWDVKGEDVEVGRHPFPVSLCVFVSVSQVKHSPCNLALGEEPGLGVMWWEGMKGRHIMTDLMIFLSWLESDVCQAPVKFVFGVYMYWIGLKCTDFPEICLVSLTTSFLKDWNKCTLIQQQYSTEKCSVVMLLLYMFILFLSCSSTLFPVLLFILSDHKSFRCLQTDPLQPHCFNTTQ